MKTIWIKSISLCAVLCIGGIIETALGAPLMASRVVGVDTTKLFMNDDIWNKAREESVVLMAQPMVIPRPATTTTALLKVRAVHDGKWIAFLLKWTDAEKSEAGRLGQFSDGVAIEFPVKDNNAPPPVFMGVKDNPVHIFQWRAQYQLDKERGMRTIADLYPNMSVDMYPMEFKDPGKLSGLTEEKRDMFSSGKAAGNPQSYAKKKGVEEIFAEGFGTSAVSASVEAAADGRWADGEWSVVIARPLKRENGSILDVGKSSYVGFAVWQGGKDEVGARKSVTMSWLPIQVVAQ
ncbi:MAG: ethylbenzene dehydrogenase-related protein [Bdellovibrionota bacterium]